MKTLHAQVKFEGRLLIAAGNPPFLVMPGGEETWIVAGRDGGNCLAFPDGLRAIFDQRQPADLLCEWFNEETAS